MEYVGVIQEASPEGLNDFGCIACEPTHHMCPISGVQILDHYANLLEEGVFQKGTYGRRSVL